MNEPEGSPDKKASRRVVGREAHWIEWATGAVSAALVVAMIGWISFQAPGEQGGAPELRVVIGDTQPTENSFRVAFTVDNNGRRTAAAVPVTGRLFDGDEVIEEREITVDYVPAQSSISGALLFSTDPAQHRLEITASGYEDP